MSNRHSWEKVRVHHYVCKKCGWVKKNIPSGLYFRPVFERGSEFDTDATPVCDAAWPEGWQPERAVSMRSIEAV